MFTRTAGDAGVVWDGASHGKLHLVPQLCPGAQMLTNDLPARERGGAAYTAQRYYSLAMEVRFEEAFGCGGENEGCVGDEGEWCRRGGSEMRTAFEES